MVETTSYTDALHLKSALEELLGAEEWYRLKDTREPSAWKQSMLRALRVTSAAIEANVLIADPEWRLEADYILQQGQQDLRRARTIVDAMSAFSACYLRLSFHQIGFMPNSRGKKVKARAVPSSWKLNSYRSVQYVQSDLQKLMIEFDQDQRPVADKKSDPKYQSLRS